MVKKANAIICAICAMFAIIITIICTNTTTASAEEATYDINNLISIANANNGTIFMYGTSDDDVIPENFSVSNYVKTYKEQLLTTEIYARNNSEMKVSESTVMEFRNQFCYSGEQKLTVHEDIISGEIKIMFERPDTNGKTHYVIYTFDNWKWPYEAEEANQEVVRFNYLGFRYIIFVQNNKFCITKIWDPETHTRVYEALDASEPALIRKLKQAFTEGTDITFIEEIDYYTRIHAFVNNNGEKEEYIFYTYNGKPVTENSEIIVSVDTVDDTYTIYVEDGFVCLDSAKRSGWVDHPNATNIG